MEKVKKLLSWSVLKAVTSDWLSEVWGIFWSLLKIMVPILLIVRVIEQLGWVELVGELIQPIMSMVGLPGETGLVWVANMFGNIYAGMAVFYQLGLAGELTLRR